MMGTLADAWNAGDSRTALALFADDAHYVEPPEYQYPSELDWEAFSAGNRF
jgi:hypothetical protein